MSSNLAWGIRTAFALLALALVTVIANGRAMDGRDERTQRLMRDVEPVFLVGETLPDARASAMLDHDAERVELVSFTLPLRCAPAQGRRMFAFYELVPDGSGAAADGVLRLRHRVADTHLPWRLRGASTVAVDARYDARRFTGTASARVVLADGAGVCRADDVPLRFAAEPGATP